MKSKEGRPIALLANYSLHYVGGVRGGEVSADYFAIFADRIQELLGADRQNPAFVGIMTNGTSGDINNIDFVNKRPRRKPYEQMTLVARDVAEKVFRAEKEMKYRDWVPLGTSASELTLKVRKPDEKLLARAKRILEQADETQLRHRREETYARRTIALSTSPDEASIPLQAIRIGELGIAAIPFETFVEIPEAYPDDAPVYPGTKPNTTEFRRGLITLAFNTEDDLETVRSWSSEFLSSNGWSDLSETALPDGTIIDARKDGRQMSVLLSTLEESGRQVTIIVVATDPK